MSVRGQTQSFSWELSRRGTQSNIKQGPKNLPIFGKRKNAGNPNEPSEFFVARPF